MIPWNKGLTKETDPRVRAYGEKISRENNRNWKGGKKLHPCGYVLVLRPDHPRADRRGYVLEHILVWERYRGPIPPGYVVHHKNGIYSDNRIKNLELITNEENGRRQRKNPRQVFKMPLERRRRISDSVRRFYGTRKRCPFLKPGESMKNGYIMVSMPDHPRSDNLGRVLKHVLVWEEANGRPVPPGWDVHHRDGDRLNNRPLNLVAEPHEIHARRKGEKLSEERKMKVSQGMRRYWVQKKKEEDHERV